MQLVFTKNLRVFCTNLCAKGGCEVDYFASSQMFIAIRVRQRQFLGNLLPIKVEEGY